MQEIKDRKLTEDSPEITELTERILERCNGHSYEEIFQAWYCACAFAGMKDCSVERAKQVVLDTPELTELVNQFCGLCDDHSHEEICLALNEANLVIKMNMVFRRERVQEDAPFSESEFYEESRRTAELANKMLELCDGYTHAEIEQAASSVAELTGRKGIFSPAGVSQMPPRHQPGVSANS